MDLPSIKATLSDKEYALIVSMAGDNLGEEQRVPSGAAWLEETLAAQEAQDAGDAGWDWHCVHACRSWAPRRADIHSELLPLLACSVRQACKEHPSV